MDEYSIHFINKVIDLVIQNEHRIAETSGKDLIVLLGPTQVEKSTLINALLGTVFRILEDDSLEPISPDQLVARVGNNEKLGLSSTEWPASYISSSSNLCLLDRQRSNQEVNMASSILLEMAINPAKSAKIVWMIKYSSIQDGIDDFNRKKNIFCDLLTLLISNDLMINKDFE